MPSLLTRWPSGDWGLAVTLVHCAPAVSHSRPSRRYGVEFANYYTPVPWLTLDADFSFSHARFRDSDPAGDHIPGSVESVIATGVTLQQPGERGFFCGLRLGYFGPHPLVEELAIASAGTGS